MLEQDYIAKILNLEDIVATNVEASLGKLHLYVNKPVSMGVHPPGWMYPRMHCKTRRMLRQARFLRFVFTSKSSSTQNAWFNIPVNHPNTRGKERESLL